MYEQPTAREQFARDCMLVLENTRPAYEHIMKKAKRLNANGEPVNTNTHALAEFLRCTGWGINPFYDMAQDFMTAAAESAGV